MQAVMVPLKRCILDYYNQRKVDNDTLIVFQEVAIRLGADVLDGVTGVLEECG